MLAHGALRLSNAATKGWVDGNRMASSTLTGTSFGFLSVPVANTDARVPVEIRSTGAQY